MANFNKDEFNKTMPKGLLMVARAQPKAITNTTNME